jgi:uncharacterized protein (DUF362 family)
MDRRHFLRTGAVGLSAAALAGLVPRVARAQSTTADLAIVRGKGIAAMVTRAVDALGGIGHFVKSGETVLLKPNAAWDRTPELGATTHPEVVAALVALCKKAGAGKVIVADRTCHDAKKSFESSGILVAAQKEGAEVLYEDLTYTARTFGGEGMKEWSLLDLYIKADKVINVPVVKHHGLSRMTCAMKNWFGAVGGKRALLHADIHTTVADLAAACRPSLTVVDATRILLDNGPTGGSLEDVKTMDMVAAGYDQVACDAWACTLMDMKWTDLGYLKKAAERKIGETDLARLKVERIEL